MLNIDLATIIFQVINFLVLAVLLNRILFQPMLRNAAQRKAEREQLVQELAAERQSAISMRDEQEQWQSRVHEEALQVTKEERARAEAEREGLLAQAQAEAERVLVEAQSDAQRLTQQALEEFHDGLVNTVLLVSSSVIDRVSPPQVHDALVSGLVERIQEMGRSEMRRIESIRQSLGEREPTAFVTSARELSTEQQGQLAQILTSLADRRVSFEIKTDSHLVAGVRVRLGDTLIDNSIEGRLEELREQVLSALKEQVNDATS